MKREKIAIVGMGAVLPSCRNLQEFWGHVLLGQDLSRELPDDRWGPKEQVLAFLDPQASLDHIPHTRGYYIDDKSTRFEAHGLKVETELLSRLDPLFQFALQAGRDAFFDCQWSAVDRSKAGVILGNLALPTEYSSRFVHESLGRRFQELQFEEFMTAEAPVDAINYFPSSMPSVMLAKALGFGARSLSLDAACSSSLYAIKFAVDELIHGRASLMLAGGVCRPDSLFTQMGFTQLQALSRSGVSRPFDVRADGLMVGEGAAILALKRLSDAEEAGDHIYGVIAGIGLSNDMDGRLMAPSHEGQMRAMQAAYREAGWGPEQVSYLECHATGTQLGDQTELQTWVTLREQSKERHLTPCVLSSSKGNIGHLLTASGAAGLIRLLLCLHEKVLAPTANFAQTQSDWQSALKAANSSILPEFRLWEGEKRRAAISAFGFGGTNAHLLIEEYAPEQASVFPAELPPVLAKEAREDGALAIVGIGMHSGADRDWQQPRAWLKSCRSSARQSAQESFDLAVHDMQDAKVCAWREFKIPYGSFRIPPQEFHELLPQQISMLLAAAQATSDARWAKQERPRSAVFIGLDVDGMANAFRTRWSLPADGARYLRDIGQEKNLSPDEQTAWFQSLADEFSPPLTANRVLGSLASLVASRIAREYRCGGMGLTISMMENSGLLALDRAVQQIRMGAIDEAIVGVVDRSSQLAAMLARHRLLQTGGQSVEEFSEDMALALVIKPQSAALRDGDHVYGLIHELDGYLAQDGLSLAAVNRSANIQAVNYEAHKTSDAKFYCRSAGSPLLRRSLERLRVSNAQEESEVPAIYDEAIQQGTASGLTALLDALAVVDQLHDKESQRQLLNFNYASSDGHIMQALVELNPAGLKKIEAVSETQAKPALTVPVGAKTWQKIPLQQEKNPVTDRVERMEEMPTEMLMSAKTPMAAPLGFIESMAQLAEKAMAHEQLAQRHHLALQNQITSDIYANLRSWQNLPQSAVENYAATNQLSQHDARIDDAAKEQEKLSKHEEPLFDYEACREFAEGFIANVFGEDFAEVDQYPTRVRLPMDRLLLCHRVMALHGEAKSLRSGILVTEHDVSADSWYLDHDHIPTAIAIEAGQADLMLSAWLGADFHTKGLAVYRLLDAKVVFHDVLPRPGDVIRYQIKIENFFRQGQTLFFRFGFAATVNNKPLLTMEDGCAGFFSPGELNAGRGIVKPGFMDKPRLSGSKTGGFEPLFSFSGETYNAEQLDALRNGDLAACFGPAFANLPSAPLTIPGGDLRLVHRITNLESSGGWFGQGLAIGEADIQPDDWFLTCHFKDDHVMPGTLMYECCLHTLRVFLLRMGWVGASDRVQIAPVQGIQSQLKCRGQVLSHTKTVRYELHIREMGYQPDAYVLADALMYADDKLIVDIHNMSLSLLGLKRDDVERIWEDRSLPASKADDPVFSQDQIIEFACGRPSRAFGPNFASFDEERRLARLPRPPYQLISEVISTDVSLGKMAAQGTALARYVIPENIWYFAAEAGHKMPFSILLEVGLQACGWMAAYMGSALTSSDDLFFRNLQGRGQLYQDIGPEHRELLTEVRCVNISQSAGMILQSYQFRILSGKDLVYAAETSFGFFTEAALATQKGLNLADLPKLPADLPDITANSSAVTHPWHMIDYVERYEPMGGQFAKGRLLGFKSVNPEEWFFHAHFFQDPVMPGSLGLEGFVQLMRQVAETLAPEETRPWRLQQGSEQEWIYRGQVRPHASLIWYDLHVKDWDATAKVLVADGYLWVDDLPIYAIKDFTLSLDANANLHSED